jgi:hypothetical protein
MIEDSWCSLRELKVCRANALFVDQSDVQDRLAEAWLQVIL